MKSKFYKCLVLASAFALVNCGDDAVDPVSSLPSGNANDVVESSGSVVAEQEGDVLLGSSSSAPENIAESSSEGGVEQVSSSESAQSSADAAVSPGSSDDAVGESSSSSEAGVEVASSSSEEPAADQSSSSETAPEYKVFLAQAADEDDGVPHKYIENTGYDGKGILAYPEQLSSDPDVKHRVVVWGPGGDTEPGAYGGMIRRLASHGFVVIAISISPGTGDNMVAAIDWMEKKNEDPSDPLYGKLDFSKVGCAGHSMGGLESEQAAIKDPRVYTIVLNNSGDKKHKAMSEISKDKTMLNIYGEGGMERPNAEADYNNAGVVGGACLVRMTGGQGTECADNGHGGVDCGWGHGSASWGGIAGTIAWMRWQLGGEDRKADFVGASGKYIDGPIIGSQGKWAGTCKNF